VVCVHACELSSCCYRNVLHVYCTTASTRTQAVEKARRDAAGSISSTLPLLVTPSMLEMGG
jgi:hypothetical protein